MAKATTSSTQIANLAMDLLGSQTITDLTNPDTEEARLLARHYAHARDSILEEHFWNFAQKRASIGADPTAPAFEFDHRYALPNDYLQLRKLNGYPASAPTDRYQIEDGYILTDADSCEIVYTYRNEVVSDYPEQFIKYLAVRLAAEAARNLAGSHELQAALAEMAKECAAAAREHDTTGNRWPHRGIEGMIADSRLRRARFTSEIG